MILFNERIRNLDVVVIVLKFFADIINNNCIFTVSLKLSSPHSVIHNY